MLIPMIEPLRNYFSLNMFNSNKLMNNKNFEFKLFNDTRFEIYKRLLF